MTLPLEQELHDALHHDLWLLLHGSTALRGGKIRREFLIPPQHVHYLRWAQ